MFIGDNFNGFRRFKWLFGLVRVEYQGKNEKKIKYIAVIELLYFMGNTKLKFSRIRLTRISFRHWSPWKDRQPISNVVVAGFVCWWTFRTTNNGDRYRYYRQHSSNVGRPTYRCLKNNRNCKIIKRMCF